MNHEPTENPIPSISLHWIQSKQFVDYNAQILVNNLQFIKIRIFVIQEYLLTDTFIFSSKG